MIIKQSQINELSKLIKNKGFQSWHFQIQSVNNDTTFFSPSPTKGSFSFKDKKKSGYTDPIKKFNKFIVTFAPNDDNANEKEEYLIDFESCKERFDKWLDIIKGEINAEEIAFKMGYKFKNYDFNNSEAWTDSDQEKARMCLLEVAESLHKISVPEGFKEKMLEQNKQILEEIKLIRIGSEKIITKKFVLQQIIGYLLTLAMSHIGNTEFINSFMDLFFTKISILELAPRQTELV